MLIIETIYNIWTNIHSELCHMHRTFSPHGEVKCVQNESPHIASLSIHSPPLSHTLSEITALQAALPQKWKWMHSPPVVGAEEESGKARGKNERREGKDMATIQDDESGKQDSPTLTLIVYVICDCVKACITYITQKLKSCTFRITF